MDQPNILLITADQLRYDCLGCNGNPLIQTPNLDQLARDGICFDNAYTTAPLCVPARLSILTGQYPSAHGALQNRASIPEGSPTIANTLRSAGYRTAAFGKMHFRPVYADFGFDRMLLAEQDGSGWRIDDYHRQYLNSMGLADQWDLWDQQPEYRSQAPEEYWRSYGAKVSQLPESVYHSTWIAEQTLAFIREKEARPFFAWVSFIKPHHPFDPPAPYDRMYSPAEVPVPVRGDAWRNKPLLNLGGDPRIAYFDTRDMPEEALRTAIAMYYGTVSHMDRQIGRILAELKTNGHLDNTLVIFTSDHGDYLGQYGLFLKHPNIPYDPLAKVPLIISGAKAVSRTRWNGLTSLVDLVPTIIETAGTEFSGFTQGVSLAPLLSGTAAPLHQAVFSETNAVKAVRTPDYKYIYSPQGPTEELYYLPEDPDELNNIAGENRTVVEEHRRLLLDWMIQSSWNPFSVKMD